jgi:hypothetical protein
MWSACSPPPTTIQDTLLQDRDRGDVTAIRAHGWQLWDQLAGGAVPQWDRWAPTERMFQHAPSATPRFRMPRPFRNGDEMMSEALPVMFDVVFDPHAQRHVAEHQLGDRARLGELDAFPAFPTDAVALKLTWFAVKAHGPTTMPIWDGEPAQAGGNPDTTWQRAIAVDPDQLDAFIHEELTEANVASARIAAHDPTLEVGDHAVLVAAHVTTKEIPDWTWQTYWWHDRPDEGRFAAGRPALHGAAANYLMDATYSTDQPCFNPWLEARFPDGVASNCVTCHQRAVVGAADYLPVTRGRLRTDDPYFSGHLATDFLWSVAFEAR